SSWCTVTSCRSNAPAPLHCLPTRRSSDLVLHHNGCRRTGLSHRHLLIVLLVVLLLGGAAAWLIVGGDASVNPAADVATERAAPPSITPLEGESASSRPASPTAADAPLSMGDKPAREAEAAGAGQTRE